MIVNFFSIFREIKARETQMKTLKKALLTEEVRPLFQDMRIGIEKESQRVTLEGTLAHTDHPKTLGNRSYHPTIQTDFSETQMELITPVANSAHEVVRQLTALHDVALRSMDAQEMLWTLSMPPVLPKDEKKIKIAKLEAFEDVLYRRYLAKEYGKRKQMVSGVHYNFEFTPIFIQKLFQAQTTFQTIEELRSYIYLKTTRNYLRHRWLITYLLGASPLAEEGYFSENESAPTHPVRSLRNSHYGYTNHPDVQGDYTSVARYVAQIEALVEQGTLSEEKEFYAPVRLRGGKKVSDLKAHGVHYIEIRNLDLNPFSNVGITESSVRFIQLFLMAMLWMDEPEMALQDSLEVGNRLNEQVALEEPLAQTKAFEAGKQLISCLKELADAFILSQADIDLIETAERALEQPENTLAGRWLNTLKKENKPQLELATEYGQHYQQQRRNTPYQLSGYEKMELSTQILLFDAIQAGLSVEILDEHEQFVKLSYKKHHEYIKNANMTSKDSYIAPLIMENKSVTKKLLAEAGFQTPAGREFSSIDEAKQAFPYFAHTPIVIKPKSTNYGLGISIFKEEAALADYEAGLAIAFKEDNQVLVEEFLSGTEYRFFVIDGQVRAILLRTPANVTGDGIHTVEELVTLKNDDPLRGTHHRAPLEKIGLGELEQLMLKEQGFQLSSIPALGETVYLRENSNISTGGDSIDITDKFDDSYKNIAVEAVSALGAKICGIDLIIPNKNLPCQKDSQSYGIIEANFNPAMHMHTYPYKGTPRRLTKDVLRFLFPEVKII